MTAEEAIEYIECGAVAHCLCVSNKKHGGNCEGEDGVNKAIEMAIDALKKQIPAKPHKSRNEYYCPRCYDDIKTCVGKNHIDGHKKRLDYCFNCGQKIDWSDEK